MTSIRNIAAIFAFASAATLSFAALAADDKTGLPGVEGNHKIVQPLPEPDKAEADSPYGPGFVKIGDSYVKVSGTIRYDVDFSSKDKKSGK